MVGLDPAIQTFWLFVCGFTFLDGRLRDDHDILQFSNGLAIAEPTSGFPYG